MSKGKLLVLKRENKILTLLMNRDRLDAATASPMEEAGLSGEENAAGRVQVGDIYIGKVQNIVKNIEAAFVETAKGVLCYLPLSETDDAVITNRKKEGGLRAGDELVVQVSREALKSKLPAVTARISLSGRYTVLAAGTPKLGFSNKLDREKKQEILKGLWEQGIVYEARVCSFRGDRPYGMVIRTNAGALQGDITPLTEEWKTMEEEYVRLMEAAGYRPCHTCLKKSPPAFLESLKNFYREEYEEIITDIPEIFAEISSYMHAFMGSEQIPVRLYEDKQLPLEKLYSVESRLENALNRRIWLRSGGYLVIEPTEALTVIDVNTGKYDAKKGSLSETCKKINEEAAEEIARQLRLRNLSGIIVVDFISMEKEAGEDLLALLRNLVKKDPVRTTVVDMTPLGLVEITRKKINKPLKEQLQT